jgi:hypothetical protein
MIRSRWVEDAFDETVQRQHNADPGKHRWPATFRKQ